MMNKMHCVFLLAALTSWISPAGQNITTPCLEPSKSIEHECTVTEQKKSVWKICCSAGQAMMIADGWKCGYCDQYHVYRCGYCVPVPDGYQVCAVYHTDEQVHCRIGKCLRRETHRHPTRRCKHDKPRGTDDDVEPTSTTLEATSTTVSTTESHSTTSVYPTQHTILVINGSTTSINNTHTETTSVSVVNDSIYLGKIIGGIIGGFFLVAVVVCNRNKILEFITRVGRWLCNP